MKQPPKYLAYPTQIAVLALVTTGIAWAAAGGIDPANRWAWGTNIGWINFAPTHGGVTVYDDHLEGIAWGENVGWIRLGTHTDGGVHTYANNSHSDYGVNNDGNGNLSGYAWGTSIGWINFNPQHGQVTINPSTGKFDGYAWGENVGWIHFRNTGDNAYNVAALWTPSATMPGTGFPPYQTTSLPAQKPTSAYASLGDLWLEIPSLGVQKNIVGVPQAAAGWDVTWLGSDIGYLHGTAFPTWPGNTALTGHVYDANGLPGPFVDLGKLWWGHKILIHAWGQQYTYEVRSMSWWTKPDDTDAVTRHEDYDWITLITCRGYDENTNRYRYRTVVRAVLVAVK